MDQGGWTSCLLLSDANAPAPKSPNLLIGDYKFELQTTDNLGATAKDTVLVKSMPLRCPSNWISFTANASGQGAALKWTTAEETGDEQFLIEASDDGKQFATV